MSILKEKKSGSGIGIDARVEVVDKLQEHSEKVSGKDVLAVARLITDILVRFWGWLRNTAVLRLI